MSQCCGHWQRQLGRARVLRRGVIRSVLCVSRLNLQISYTYKVVNTIRADLGGRSMARPVAVGRSRSQSVVAKLQPVVDVCRGGESVE